jgi:hypothetical protein
MRVAVWSLACTVGLLPWAARGQDETESPPPTVITIRPAASPVPALKYSLLPKPEGLIPGNAAIFYHRAIERLLERRSQERPLQLHDLKTSRIQAAEEEEERARWLTQPLAKLPREKVREYLQRHEFSLHECELGARREFCNWEFQRRDEGFNLILSDMQEMRSLGRLLVLKARLEIADGRIDSAIHWLQTGLAVARHVNESNTLIQMLISAAMTSMMAVPLEDLIQAPGAPNLYWALANLPRPFLELTTAMEGERHILEKEFPQLKTIEQAVWSLDQARAYADDFQNKMAMLTGDWARASSSSAQPEMKDFGAHLMFTALVARAYPEAKRALIAQGHPAAQLEAMPAVQVVAIHSYRLYEEARDDIFKWTALPYWQGQNGMSEAEFKPRAGWAKLKGGIPFSVVLPAIHSGYVVPTRVDRRLDVVRIVEAVRLYATHHGGSLPPNLDALTEAPAPIDPATGKPYSYKSDGSTATLTAPGPPGLERIPQYKINYQLKLAH